MSGIKERRLWDRGTLPSQAAIMAGKDTLQKADISPDKVDCLFFTSVSRDMMEPATASFVHHGLNLSKDCLIFDISNACLGFLDGMMMLANMIELVITSYSIHYTKLYDRRDRIIRREYCRCKPRQRELAWRS